MVKTLWEIVKIVACVYLIGAIVKIMIEEWLIKPIQKKRMKKNFIHFIDDFKEEYCDKCEDCKKKTTKKTKDK